MAEAEDGERERLQHRDALHEEQQPALVGSIGDETAPRTEEQHGSELRGGERPEGDPAIGELEDEQGLRDEREPVADLRDQLSGEEQPEVTDSN